MDDQGYTQDPSHAYRTIACRNCGHTIVAPISCGNRFCPTCSGPRRRRVRAKLDAICANVHPPPNYALRFITLTIPHVENLNVGSSQLIASFRRLRQRAFWRSHVLGGAFVLEVTGRPGAWHLHLHAIAEARYIPVGRLSTLWSQVSTGKIVYVKRIPAKSMIAYVTKYVTKSCLSSENQKAASSQLRNRRVFNPFGTWHSIVCSIPKIDFCCPICGNTTWLPLDDRTLRHIKLHAHPV